VKAIPDGPPSKKAHNQSNIIGVKKWSVDGEKCFGFWAAQNTDCSICIRVCPYNKDYSRWLHKLGLRLAGTRLRHFILWLDVKLGYGERQKSSLWWLGVREKLLARYAKIFFKK
jgi:ferredoxin